MDLPYLIVPLQAEQRANWMLKKMKQMIVDCYLYEWIRIYRKLLDIKVILDDFHNWINLFY